MRNTRDLYSLDGRVAVVTGGRGRYGHSISLGLCEMGASTVIASRDGKSVRNTRLRCGIRDMTPSAWRWISAATNRYAAL